MVNANILRSESGTKEKQYTFPEFIRKLIDGLCSNWIEESKLNNDCSCMDARSSKWRMKNHHDSKRRLHGTHIFHGHHCVRKLKEIAKMTSIIEVIVCYVQKSQHNVQRL